MALLHTYTCNYNHFPVELLYSCCAFLCVSRTSRLENYNHVRVPQTVFLAPAPGGDIRHCKSALLWDSNFQNHASDLENTGTCTCTTCPNNPVKKDNH